MHTQVSNASNHAQQIIYLHYVRLCTRSTITWANAYRLQEADHSRRCAERIQVHCRLYHWCITPPPLAHIPFGLIRRNVERINTFHPTPEKPFVLGLPTGSSPVLIYQQLVQRHKAGEISFRNVVTFNMVRPIDPAGGGCSLAWRSRTAAWRRNDDRPGGRTSMSAYRANTLRATTASCTSTFSRM